MYPSFSFCDVVRLFFQFVVSTVLVILGIWKALELVGVVK